MDSTLIKHNNLMAFCVLCLMFLYSSAAHAGLNWFTDLNEAQQYAQEHNKHILLNFTGSDWCPWCIKLDKKIFSTQEFADFAQESLVLVKIDFPKKTRQSQEQKDRNQKLAQEYWVRGFPTIIILDQNGEEVARTGYQRGTVQTYIENLKQSMD